MKGFLVLVLLSVLDYAWGYPGGAPVAMCGRYIPQHNNRGTPVGPSGPRTGSYAIEVTPAGNKVFSVTLRSTSRSPFKGFLIQAIDATSGLPAGPSDVIGGFQPDFANPQSTRTSQIRTCSPFGGTSFLTHADKNDKTMVRARWTAPGSLLSPDIKFIATVVQDYDHFYVVYSDPVKMQEVARGAGNTFNPTTGPSSGSRTPGLPSNTFGGTGTSLNTGRSFTSGSTFGGLPSSSAGSTIFGVSTGNGNTFGGTTGVQNMSTGASSNVINETSSGIPVQLDSKQVELFTLDPTSPIAPPPPIVLPNGDIAINTLDNSGNSISTIPSKTSVSFTSVSSPVLASGAATIDSSATSRDLSINSISSSPDSLVTSGGIAVSASLAPADNVGLLDGALLSLTTGASSKVTRETPSNEPTVQIIEIPILPEGQTAALLNINRNGRTRPDSAGQGVRTRTSTSARSSSGDVNGIQFGSGSSMQFSRNGLQSTGGMGAFGQRPTTGPFGQGPTTGPFMGTGSSGFTGAAGGRGTSPTFPPFSGGSFMIGRGGTSSQSFVGRGGQQFRPAGFPGGMGPGGQGSMGTGAGSQFGSSTGFSGTGISGSTDSVSFFGPGGFRSGGFGGRPTSPTATSGATGGSFGPFPGTSDFSAMTTGGRDFSRFPTGGTMTGPGMQTGGRFGGFQNGRFGAGGSTFGRVPGGGSFGGFPGAGGFVGTRDFSRFLGGGRASIGSGSFGGRADFSSFPSAGGGFRQGSVSGSGVTDPRFRAFQQGSGMAGQNGGQFQGQTGFGTQSRGSGSFQTQGGTSGSFQGQSGNSGSFQGQSGNSGSFQGQGGNGGSFQGSSAFGTDTSSGSDVFSFTSPTGTGMQSNTFTRFGS